MAFKLGPHGENIFTALCSSEGLISTSPGEDENGWDHFVEFPWEKIDNISLDLQEIPVRCKVQLKSTNIKDQRKLNIKLSAMHKLAVEQMPSFLCFMHFNNTISSQEIYVVHIDKDICGKILSRVRKAEKTGSKINRQVICIHYTLANKLDEPTGKMLKNEIMRYIPNGIESYITEKQAILKTLGFKDQDTEIKFTIKENLKRDDFIEKYLVNKEKINIKIDSVTQERFGIKLPLNSFMNSENAMISFDSKQSKIKLIAKKDKYDKSIIINLESRFHPLVQNAIMIYNECLTIIIDYSKLLNNVKLTAKLDPNKKLEFDIILNYMKLLKLSQNNINEDITWKLYPVNKQLEPLQLSTKLHNRFDIDESVFNTVFLYEKLFNHLNIGLKIKCSLDSLVNRTKHAEIFYTFLTTQDYNSFTLESTFLKGDRVYLPQKIEKFIVLLPLYLVIEDTIYVLITEIVAIAQINDDHLIRVFGKKGRILKNYEIKKDEFNENEFETKLINIVKDLGYKEYAIKLKNEIIFEINDSRTLIK